MPRDDIIKGNIWRTGSFGAVEIHLKRVMQQQHTPNQINDESLPAASSLFLIKEFTSDGSGTEPKGQVSKSLKQKGNADANSHLQLNSMDTIPRVTCQPSFI